MVSEFKSIFDLVKAFPTEESCIKQLEDIIWNGTPVSPFKSDSVVYKLSNGQYKCKDTNKKFNVKVGTIFENTKIPLQKWFMALFLFSSHKKGISSHQLAKDINVTQKSAWFMLHRLRYAFDHPNFRAAMLEDEVEVDETYIGGKEKNKHRSKKTEGSQGRSTKSKAAVLGMKQRNGDVYAEVVTDTKAKTIVPIIHANIEKGSNVYTDEWGAYNNLNKVYIHDRVYHAANQYVNGQVSTNGIENFWSHLKRGIDGIYHWASTKHLQQYVSEFTLRYNTRKSSTCDRFNLVLANIDGRLTYKSLISND
ncbi:MAG: IS1595 family transposase [Flavobacteriales bacterium]|nr:IS1595 family transposase [Flavobacteriales bacterium]